MHTNNGIPARANLAWRYAAVLLIILSGALLSSLAFVQAQGAEIERQ